MPTKLRTGAPREAEVLCPPARMARHGASLETWCEENGERGARLLAEYADTEKSAREVTKASKHKALWNCRDCGHEWRARVDNRTKSGGKRNPTSGGKRNPTDCPACSGYGTSLETWCEENGERGAKLLAEYADTEKGAREVTKASEHKALWSCRDCGHEWRATVKDRTRSDRPTGCPACTTSGVQATATHNLKLTCEESEGRLAHLLGQWNHPTMRMEDFTPGSAEKVPWKCEKCGWKWDAVIYSRTKSDCPTGCPGCKRRGGRPRKPIEL